MRRNPDAHFCMADIDVDSTWCYTYYGGLGAAMVHA